MKNKENIKINENYLLLRLFGFEFERDKMTKLLGLTPKNTGKQGEEYYTSPSKNRTKIWEYNHWEYESKKITAEYIGEFISAFFEEIIKPRLGILKR